MEKKLNITRKFAIILLLFVGIPAVLSGIIMIIDPDGKLLKLSTGYLMYTPFRNFFIPGILLFGVIGLGSLFAAYVSIQKVVCYSIWLIIMGLGLTIWTLTQLSMKISFNFLHAIYGGIGIILLIIGIWGWNYIRHLRAEEKKNQF